MNTLIHHRPQQKSRGGKGGIPGKQFILIYLRGTDSRDYKFSSAVLEDYSTLSPKLRERFLAASVFWLKGSGAPDSALVARTRAVIQQLAQAIRQRNLTASTVPAEALA